MNGLLCSVWLEISRRRKLEGESMGNCVPHKDAALLWCTPPMSCFFVHSCCKCTEFGIVARIVSLRHCHVLLLLCVATHCCVLLCCVSLILCFTVLCCHSLSWEPLHCCGIDPEDRECNTVVLLRCFNTVLHCSSVEIREGSGASCATAATLIERFSLDKISFLESNCFFSCWRKIEIGWEI